MMIRLTCLIVAIALSLAAAGAEKKPALPFLGETIEVSIVNLDVVVTDREGNRVRGLTGADFVVLENGKNQPLSHFAEYRGDDDGDVGVEGAPAPPLPPRTLVIFIEEFKLPRARVNPFIASIKELVRDTIRSGDQVSVILYRSRSIVAVRPTDDVAAVEKVLDEIGTGLVGPVRDLTVEVASEMIDVTEFEAGVAAAAEAEGLLVLPRNQEQLAIHATELHTMRAVSDANRLASALHIIIDGLAGVEGRKMLLLATRRFGEFVGAEFYYAAGEGMVPNEKRVDLDNKPRVLRLIEVANAAGVTIYPVFPGGADERAGDPDAPDIRYQVLNNEMVTLRNIAEKTGGLAAASTTDIVKLLTRVSDDITDYYSIAYRATTRRKDETRTVEVRTVDRSLEVRTRRQFVDRSDDSRMRDRVLAALHDQVRESPMTISATVGQRTGARRQTVPLRIRIPISQLTSLPHEGKHAGAFTVYVVTSSERGELGDVSQKTQPFEIPLARLEEASQGHFTYNFELLINRGVEKVAVGVLDEVSKSYALLTLPVSAR